MYTYTYLYLYIAIYIYICICIAIYIHFLQLAVRPSTALARHPKSFAEQLAEMAALSKRTHQDLLMSG